MIIRKEIITNWDLPWSTREAYINGLMKGMAFTFMGEGRMRRTFLSFNKRFVLKFPTSRSGVVGNKAEHDLYRHWKNSPNRDGIIFAPCRLIKDTVLLMQAVVQTFGDSRGCMVAYENGSLTRLSEKDSRFPQWAQNIDCQQVGILSNGRVVAYDYTDC